MAELKIKISDDLATKLKPFKGQLEEIIEIGLRELKPKKSLLYENVIEFLVSGPSIEDIIALRPSAKAQDRIDELLQKNKEGALSKNESAELDEYMELNHIVTLMKAYARSNIETK